MSRLVSKESAIVIGVMFGITVLAGVLRFTHEDITALFNRPSQEQIAAGEQAIEQLESTAEALDTSNLIADIAPCSRWRGFAEACVTVTDGFQRAPDRIDVAKRIWRTWADICTSKHVADDQGECILKLRSADGEIMGGSARHDASQIWVRR